MLIIHVTMFSVVNLVIEAEITKYRILLIIHREKVLLFHIFTFIPE